MFLEKKRDLKMVLSSKRRRAFLITYLSPFRSALVPLAIIVSITINNISHYSWSKEQHQPCYFVNSFVFHLQRPFSHRKDSAGYFDMNKNSLLFHRNPSSQIIMRGKEQSWFLRKETFQFSRSISRSTSRLNMALLPIPVSDLEQLLVLGMPNGAQYGTYWGRTSRETYNAVFESVAVTVLGLFGSYFLSFVIGDGLATLMGAVFAFWTLLGPELKAYQRNWEFVGGRPLIDQWMDDEIMDNTFDIFGDEKEKGERAGNGGMYGSYYIAHVSNVGVVGNVNVLPSEEYPLSEFYDYTMEKDDAERITGLPWMIRLRIKDNSGRSMQVHARMSEEYLDIQEGQPVVCVFLSSDRSFEMLSGLTDFFVPDAGCYVGDYPYLDRPYLNRMLESDEDLLELLDRERSSSFDFQYYNSDYGDDDDDYYDDDFL